MTDGTVTMWGMVDPDPFIGGGRVAIGLVKRWAEGGTLDRLLELLDRRFGDKTGLSLTQLQTWRTNAAFIEALFILDTTGDVDAARPGLVSAALGLTAAHPDKPTDAERELSNEVVSAIESLLSLAKEGDAVTRYEHRVTRAQLTPRIVLASADWAPERSQELIRELVEKSPEEGVHLQQELEGKDLAVAVRGLVERPPRWVETGTGLLLEAVASVAESTGQWEVALRAAKEASQRAGGDRVRTLVRASIAANVLGKDDDGDELFGTAKDVEKDHPSVLLREVRLEEDGDERLSILARVAPRNQHQRASLRAETAEALGLVDRFEEADDALSEAKALGVALARIEEVESELTVRRNGAPWSRGEQVDVAGLLRAAQVFLKLRDEHRELGAFQGSVLYIGRAADAYVKADHVDAAGRLVERGAVLDEELAAPRGREWLAEVAINAQRPDLVDQLLPEDLVTDNAGRLLLAMRAVHSGNSQEVQDIVPLLDRLVSKGELGFQAAVPRLLAAVVHAAEWSEAAEKMVAEREPVLASVLKAKFLARLKKWAEAERELVPFYQEPRVQHQLLGIALEEGDPAKIAHRARELLEKAPDYLVRLDSARALLRAEVREPATTELQRLAADEQAPTLVRSIAYQDLTGLALEADQHTQVIDLTESWVTLAPQDERPAWLHAQALLRLGRFEDADAFLEEHGLTPETLPEAQLAARIYSLAEPPMEALRRIVELADAQAAPDEDLEMLAVIVAMQVGEEMTPEIAERVNPARFLQLFPNTTLMQAIPAPQTEEEIRDFVRELAGGRRDIVQQTESRVFDAGEAPVAALAFAAGKHVGQLWRRLGQLPIAYGDAALQDLEVADALRALAVGAVWDSSAIFVTGLLPDAVRAQVVQALPKSVVPQSVLDDCLIDTTEPRSSEEHSELGVDAAGEPLITTWTEDAVRADERRAEDMLALARAMEVEPDALPDDDGPEATFIRDEDLARQLQTYAATFAVARRRQLAVFSDDRHVRLRARQSGLPAFGSLALLDALARRGYITSEQRTEARRTLRSWKALGTDPSAEELSSEARASAFMLTVGLAAVLQDPTVVRVRPADPARAYLDFLRAVFREAPSRFDVWVARVVDAMRITVPELSYGRHAANLLLLAWEPYEDADPAFFQALVTAIQRAEATLGPLRDPIMEASRALARIIDESPYPIAVKLAIMRTAVDQLPIEMRGRVRLAVFTPSRPLRPPAK